MTLLAAGQLIADRYRLDRRIAVGGMGEVWEASDARLGRSIAVKILRPELSGDPEFLHRFRIEARTVASLDHHGIAAIHDYGESDGASGRRTAYLVMELVRGEPLSTLIARGPIEPDETLRLIEEAAWALQAAHERGFVHRDVKPGNILVRTDGLVKLTDFGIAKAADAAPLTHVGMVMGTAHYIAPEQASGAEAGPAGDVYSLGVVGYECLAGHRPFRAENAVAVAMMQVRDAPPPLPDTVPFPARELIEAVLVKDPLQRYATGGEFAAAVAAVRRGEAMPAPRSTGRGGSLRSLRGRSPARTATPATATPARAADSRVAASRAAGSRVTGSRPAPSRPTASRDGASPATASRPAVPRLPASPATAYPASAYPATASRPAVSRAPVPPRDAEPRSPGPRALDAPNTPTRTGSHRAQRRPAADAAHGPLPVASGARRGRTLLLVMFVLLTLAAAVLGVVVLRGGWPEVQQLLPLSSASGTMTGRPVVAETVRWPTWPGQMTPSPDTVRNRQR